LQEFLLNVPTTYKSPPSIFNHEFPDQSTTAQSLFENEQFRRLVSAQVTCSQ